MHTYIPLKGQSNTTSAAVQPRTKRIPAFSRVLWPFFIDAWLPEVFAASCSIACSIVIGAILRAWSGKPMPALPHGITVNAVISILATISKSAMLFVVSSCLGQLKWNWYQSRQRLFQFELFDGASRGPLGAFQLLFGSLPFASFSASMGALIVILALTIDPFVQQVLSFPQGEVIDLSTPAIARKASIFPDPLGSSSWSAVNQGIWNTAFKQSPSCNSTDCVWKTFQTIGFCSQCQSVPSKLTSRCHGRIPEKDFLGEKNRTQHRTCQARLDGRFSRKFNITMVRVNEFNSTKTVNHTKIRDAPLALLWQVRSTPLLITGGEVYGQRKWTNSSAVVGVTNPLSAVAFAPIEYANDTGEVSVGTSQICAVDICLREHSLSIMNGTVAEQLVKRTWGKKFRYRAQSLDCWAPNATQNLTLQKITRPLTSSFKGQYQSFYVDKEKHAMCWPQNVSVQIKWSRTLYMPFQGEVELRVKDSQCEDGYCGVRSRYTTKEDLWRYSNEALRQIWTAGFADTMGNIADSLSSTAIAESNDTVQGITKRTQPFVKVRWEWLILPAMLNMSGLVLLSVVIWQTSKHEVPLWKSSTNATLFHGLYTTSNIPEANTISEMDRVAESVEVQLQFSVVEDRLVLRHINDRPTSVVTDSTRQRRGVKQEVEDGM